MMQIPVIPNSPLNHASDLQVFGPMLLRKNIDTDLIENGAFDPSIITYDQNYHNSQGHSEVFQTHLSNVINVFSQHFKPGSRLVEVGCGKGEFLDLLHTTGRYQVSGYDVSYEGESPLIHARYLTDNDRIAADGVILRHVLEHVSQPHLFLKTLHKVFGSIPIYIEVPRSEWIFDNGAFFDITYEHVNYFSEQALAALFDRKCISQKRIFEDQYQYLIANLGDFSVDFASLYGNESSWTSIDFDQLFPSITQKINHIESALHPLGRIFLWGGATKGCMFLHHCLRLSRLSGRFSMVVDINPSKWGKLMPSTMLPICNPAQLFQQVNSHDMIIVANPNYRLEVISDLHKNGFGGLKIVTL